MEELFNPPVIRVCKKVKDAESFTFDIVAVPKDKKPKPVPQSALGPAPQPAPKGKHVQLFGMRCNVGDGFYSVSVNQNAPATECYLSCAHEDECAYCCVFRGGLAYMSATSVPWYVSHAHLGLSKYCRPISPHFY